VTIGSSLEGWMALLSISKICYAISNDSNRNGGCRQILWSSSAVTLETLQRDRGIHCETTVFKGPQAFLTSSNIEAAAIIIFQATISDYKSD